ncbi:MAG: hypothetical protein B7X33_00015 [Lysobacterales bacterium 13-68-4]|nr:MAG: hypothetical protein B7X33_00015 [Xanthomonadales bacterium 13-68-4]
MHDQAIAHPAQAIDPARISAIEADRSSVAGQGRAIGSRMVRRLDPARVSARHHRQSTVSSGGEKGGVG